MHEIKLELNGNQRGAFLIREGEEKIAELAIGLTGNNIIAYHTEVSEKLRGQGVAGKLFDALINYAQENNMKIVPLCPYVHAQFKRHEEKYGELWEKDWKR